MNARLATRAGEFDDSAFVLKSMLYALVHILVRTLIIKFYVMYIHFPSYS